MAKPNSIDVSHHTVSFHCAILQLYFQFSVSRGHPMQWHVYCSLLYTLTTDGRVVLYNLFFDSNIIVETTLLKQQYIWHPMTSELWTSHAMIHVLLTIPLTTDGRVVLYDLCFDSNITVETTLLKQQYSWYPMTCLQQWVVYHNDTCNRCIPWLYELQLRWPNLVKTTVVFLQCKSMMLKHYHFFSQYLFFSGVYNPRCARGAIC